MIDRINDGMIAEVKGLIDHGLPIERLDYFGLEKLSELPDLPEIKEPQNLSLDLEPDIANEINQVSSDQLN